VLEAARLVEEELKAHHIVPAGHKMPTPVQSDNAHGYTAPAVGTTSWEYTMPSSPSSTSVAGKEDDPIDAAQAHYDDEVQRIKKVEENMLHELGQKGMAIDDAERRWENVAKGRLAQERDVLLTAVRDGTMPEAKAKEMLEDEYHAVLEAARLVEEELKAHHIVPAGHKMPTPVQSDNAHGYTAPAVGTTSWEYTMPTVHHKESPNAYGYTAPTNPDEGEAQWEAEVKRIEALEKKTLHALGVGGLSVDEAEAKWSEQVSARLSVEAKLLRTLVLKHRMRATDVEERLGDDYAAAREAAKRVDAELNAHGIHPHHPAFAAAPHPTTNLRGQTQKQKKQQQNDVDATTAKPMKTANPAAGTTTADGDFVGKVQVVYRKGEPDAATTATAKTSKTLVAADDGTLLPATDGASSVRSTSSSDGGKLFGIGIAPVAGIAVGFVGLVALAAVGVSKARGGGGQRSTEGHVLRVSSTAAGTTRSPTSSAIQHTNFVQML